jgi:hypothetical protein
MPREGFEPATPATKRPQTYALHRVTTGIGAYLFRNDNYHSTRWNINCIEICSNYRTVTYYFNFSDVEPCNWHSFYLETYIQFYNK